MDLATYSEEWLERAFIVEREGGDSRSPFGRDRDRILYSDAFRRLGGKTQVVQTSERGDYHNRLTHSLKVAQLGRRAAEKLQRAYAGSGPYGNFLAPPDPDLVEAACLAHDLGHPPFGHLGEQALSSCVDQYLSSKKWPLERTLLVGGYEGNAQTYRILTYLAVQRSTSDLRRKYFKTDRVGLNLTPATLAATVKYPWLRSDANPKVPKWGAYCTHYDAPDPAAVAFEAAHIPADHLGRKKDGTFEAQLMDWCDDVTYAVHDAIDFYQNRFLSLNELIPYRGNQPTRPAKAFIKRCLARRPDWDEDDVLLAWDFLRNCSRLDQRWEPKYSAIAATQMTASLLITNLMEGIGWVERGTRKSDDYEWNQRGAPLLYAGDLVVDPNPNQNRIKRLAVSLMKMMLTLLVHEDQALIRQQAGQQSIVDDLFRRYLDNEQLLPEHRQEQITEHGDLARGIADHISSMTELDAIWEQRRLSGQSLGPLTDVVPH
jgi:dGTPase